MARRFFKAFFLLIKYAAFLGKISGDAIYVGSNYSVKIKIAVGTVVGLMILGSKVPDPIHDYLQAFSEFNYEIIGKHQIYQFYI